MIRKMVRHHDQDNAIETDHFIWDCVSSVLLLMAFAQEGAEQGSSESRVEYCFDHKKSLCYPLHSGTLWYSDKSRSNEIFLSSLQLEWESMFFTGDLYGIYFPEWNNSRRKREWWRSTSSLLHTWIHAETTWMKKKFHFEYIVLQKVHDETCWKRNQDFSILENIIQSAGWRIAILEDKIIYNHYPSLLYQETALFVWQLRTEIECYWRSSKYWGHHQMLCQKAFGLCSNSGSLLSRKALVAYRRRMRLGKAKQCRIAKRNEKKRHGSVNFRRKQRLMKNVSVGTHLSEQEVVTDVLLEAKSRNRTSENTGCFFIRPCVFVVTVAERFHI